jgi:hypothetical protein
MNKKGKVFFTLPFFVGTLSGERGSEVNPCDLNRRLSFRVPEGEGEVV